MKTPNRVMRILYVALRQVLIILGARAHARVHYASDSVALGFPTPVAILLAFPVAMTLAVGVEAPSSAIAQLAQFDIDFDVDSAR